MKLLFILLCLLLSLNNYGQNNTQILKDIRQKYNMITELLEQDNLEEVAVRSDCNDSGQINASLHFYYNESKLVYMNYEYREGHSNNIYHYYLWDNKLIFYLAEYASWTWDYECTPSEQGFTNEIWTYEEHRVYFNDRTATKCLYKTYEEKSVDQPYEGPHGLSDTIKNEEIDCNRDSIKEIIKTYLQLASSKDGTTVDICNILN
ncbi:hypothetical protein [Aquimarina sp. 2304DJ70-9]|uniref:hypothetical protein n=1 Tax=Aquimarina penaris TaxID=3231044 RepID=UPI003462B681